MFLKLKELIEDRLLNLGLASRIDKEKKIHFLKKELTKIYNWDPSKEIYYLNKETIVIIIDNFSCLHDMQMRRIYLIERFNNMFPDEKIRELKIKI